MLAKRWGVHQSRQILGRNAGRWLETHVAAPAVPTTTQRNPCKTFEFISSNGNREAVRYLRFTDPQLHPGQLRTILPLYENVQVAPYAEEGRPHTRASLGGSQPGGSR